MVWFINKWIIVLVLLANGSCVMIREGPGEGIQFVRGSPETGWATEVQPISRFEDDLIGVYTYRATVSATPELYWFGAYPNGRIWYQPFLPAQGIALTQPSITAMDNELRICGTRNSLRGGTEVLCWQSQGNVWIVVDGKPKHMIYIPIAGVEMR